jgi:elongation factor G
MTQGRGSYEMSFERYDQVPGNIAEKIIANHKAEEEN